MTDGSGGQQPGDLGEDFVCRTAETAFGNIYWTDDHGKTWDDSVISPGRMGGDLGVSPDGRTMVEIPGRDQKGKDRELLRPGAGAPFTPPADLGELTSVGEFAYGMQYNGNHAVTSTDHGKTWKYLDPR
jgi:hypothetical protein